MLPNLKGNSYALRMKFEYRSLLQDCNIFTIKQATHLYDIACNGRIMCTYNLYVLCLLSTPLKVELGDTLMFLCENISNLFIQVRKFT